MRLIICTTAPGEGATLLRSLLEERIVAGGNIVPGIRSLYRWKGEICDEAEELLVMETSSADLAAKIARIEALHSYAVPKVLAIEPTDGPAAYLAWVKQHSDPV
ncbi:MAG: periplasmic divalent cation tolerance protein [Myxococcota bacterium]|jgi:periplasmic divalent cation tolerance protein